MCESDELIWSVGYVRNRVLCECGSLTLEDINESRVCSIRELTYKLQHAVGVNEFRVGPLEKEESVDLLFRTESTSSFPLEALTNKFNNNSFLLLASPFHVYK